MKYHVKLVAADGRIIEGMTYSSDIAAKRARQFMEEVNTKPGVIAIIEEEN